MRITTLITIHSNIYDRIIVSEHQQFRRRIMEIFGLERIDFKKQGVISFAKTIKTSNHVLKIRRKFL